MEIKKPVKKEAKLQILPLANLPMVSLTDKEMSEVNGGGLTPITPGLAAIYGV